MEFTAEAYVEDVLAGRVVVGRWARLACERHRRDVATGHERGLWFDERAARFAVAFFRTACRDHHVVDQVGGGAGECKILFALADHFMPGGKGNQVCKACGVDRIAIMNVFGDGF